MMSLEEVVKKSSKKKNFFKHCGFAVYESLLGWFLKPTLKRHRQNYLLERALKDKEPVSKLEEVTQDTIIRVVMPFQFGSLIFFPYLIPVAAATNLSSYIYEKKRSKSESEKKMDKMLNDKQLVEDTMKKYDNSGKGFKKKLRSFGKNLGFFIASYIAAGAIAFGHYNVSTATRTYDPTEVNLNIRSCELDTGKEKHQFYLSGEVHYYNYSSSKAISNMIDDVKPDILLSEGIEYKSEEEREKRINLSEYLLFFGLTPFIEGAQKNFQDVSSHCRKRDIPIKYIEKVDETGKREGVSTTMNVILGGMGLLGIINAPSFYFYGVTQNNIEEYTGSNFIDNPVMGFIMPVLGGAISEEVDLLNARNENMTDTIVDYMDKNPGMVYLVRIGDAHAEGMIELFKEKGQLVCEPYEIK